MKDELEKYIRDHRPEFDELEKMDPHAMWKDFNAPQQPKKTMKLGYYLAAAVIIVLIGATLLFTLTSIQSMDELVAEKLGQENPGLASEQANLIQLIKSQGVLISDMGITENQFPELFEELNTLDLMQEEALRDLDNLGDRKNLMRTLLRYYVRKAKVLELMIYEFEKQENENRYENDIQI